jgi:hypothetical protein
MSRGKCGTCAGINYVYWLFIKDHSGKMVYVISGHNSVRKIDKLHETQFNKKFYYEKHQFVRQKLNILDIINPKSVM